MVNSAPMVARRRRGVPRDSMEAGHRHNSTELRSSTTNIKMDMPMTNITEGTEGMGDMGNIMGNSTQILDMGANPHHNKTPMGLGRDKEDDRRLEAVAEDLYIDRRLRMATVMALIRPGEVRGQDPGEAAPPEEVLCVQLHMLQTQIQRVSLLNSGTNLVD